MQRNVAAIVVLATVVIGSVSAAKPQFSLKVRDGSYSGLDDGLDPTVSWSDTTTSGDFDLSFGVTAALRPTSDVTSLPKRVWGQADTTVSGWDVRAKVELDGQDYTKAALTTQGENSKADVSVKAQAMVGSSNKGKSLVVLESVKVTKGLEKDGARITITPRINLISEDKDVVVTYQKDQTGIRLLASKDYQEVTLSQQVDEKNRIAPTVNSAGDVSAVWEHTISDTASVIANFRPNEDLLDVKWKDGDWTATFDMPVSGAMVKGAKVGIQRDVKF